MTRVLIDTDAGVDDTLAIVYAASSPEIELEMVTTVSGNVPVREVTQNVLYLKEILKLGVPVHSGADVPRARKLVTAPEVHGEDGVGGFRNSNHVPPVSWETKDAAKKIVSAAIDHGPKLTIVSLGPMTNLADAVAIDAEAIRHVQRIIQMGGVFTGYGNTTEFTEFNIYVDPEAADFVLSNGIKVKFVPLDLTERLFFPRPILEDMVRKSRTKNPQLARLLKKALRYYINYHRRTEKIDGCFLHDPIAVAAAVNPRWFKFVDSLVSIETKGDYTSGMTIADFRKRQRSCNSEIAVAFDAKNFVRDFTRKVFGALLHQDVIKRDCITARSTTTFDITLN